MAHLNSLTGRKGERYKKRRQAAEREPVIFIGIYDKGKPRVRLLLEGAKRGGYSVYECHIDIWHDIEDKSQIQYGIQSVRYIFRWFITRLKLLYCYLRAPAHQLVVIPYPGVLELLFFYPVIKLRGGKIFFDAFISPYDTIVNDRQLVRKNGMLAKTLYTVEWIAARAADVVFLDTQSHSLYFQDLFNLPNEVVAHVPVGVEISMFPRKSYFPWTGEAPLQVLFYGQFVPLQGTMTLLEAISTWEIAPQFTVQWTVIGKGQDSEKFDRKLAELSLKSVRRVDWIPYLELSDWIEKSDVCCGIFGASQKALNVIPNKVYQVLSVGRPILTADTPGIRSLLSPGPAVELIRPCDSTAIVEGLRDLGRRLLENPEEMEKSVAGMPIVGPQAVGERLASILQGSSRK